VYKIHRRLSNSYGYCQVKGLSVGENSSDNLQIFVYFGTLSGGRKRNSKVIYEIYSKLSCEMRIEPGRKVKHVRRLVQARQGAAGRLRDRKDSDLASAEPDGDRDHRNEWFRPRGTTSIGWRQAGELPPARGFRIDRSRDDGSQGCGLRRTRVTHRLTRYRLSKQAAKYGRAPCELEALAAPSSGGLLIQICTRADDDKALREVYKLGGRNHDSPVSRIQG